MPEPIALLWVKQRSGDSDGDKVKGESSREEISDAEFACSSVVLSSVYKRHGRELIRGIKAFVIILLTVTTVILYPCVHVSIVYT